MRLMLVAMMLVASCGGEDDSGGHGAVELDLAAICPEATDLAPMPDLADDIAAPISPWHLMPMADGSWDWDGDGRVEYEFPFAGVQPPFDQFKCGMLRSDVECEGAHWYNDASSAGFCGRPLAVILCGWNAKAAACEMAGSQPTAIERCK